MPPFVSNTRVRPLFMLGVSHIATEHLLCPYALCAVFFSVLFFCNFVLLSGFLSV